jgi:peptide-methionine (R)-S-oxide reductase
MVMSDSDYKKILSPEAFDVMFNKATEAPYSGELLYNEEDGTYLCAACKSSLFTAAHKFEAGCGWPSFYNVIDPKAVKLSEDNSLNMKRVEVSCSQCGGHLGHVFNDAPDTPTGVRFCVNSLALDFKSES